MQEIDYLCVGAQRPASAARGHGQDTPQRERQCNSQVPLDAARVARWLNVLVGRHIVQPLGLLGNNIGVLDLYSRYDAPKRNSSSRSSYTFTKTSNAGANRMSTQSTNSTD